MVLAENNQNFRKTEGNKNKSLLMAAPVALLLRCLRYGLLHTHPSVWCDRVVNMLIHIKDNMQHFLEYSLQLEEDSTA